MDGRTNAGGVAAFAVISAKYPAGSICTCSDGNIRFTAKATSDSALFFIPFAGTWIVTATDGDSTTSKTVEITSEGQNVSVELSYGFWIFKSGEGAVVPISKSVEGSAAVTIGTNSIVTKANGSNNLAYSTTEKIDLTNYTAMRVKAKQSSVQNGSNYIGRFGVTDKTLTYVSGYQTGWPANVLLTTGSAAQDYSVDLSNVNGKYYCAFWGSADTEAFDWYLI